MLSIVPPSGDNQGGFDHTEAMSRVDGCPGCISNYEAPRAVLPDSTCCSFVAAYSCHDCGHVWLTSWGVA